MAKNETAEDLPDRLGVLCRSMEKTLSMLHKTRTELAQFHMEFREYREAQEAHNKRIDKHAMWW